MNLKEAREMLATDLSTLVYAPATETEDAKHVRCTPRPVKGNLRQGDGWVVLDTIGTSDFQGEATATLIGYVVLGSDERKADELADELTVPMLKVGEGMAAFNITVRPIAIIAGEATSPGSIYALALTLTKEISSS